jgi:lipoprotein LprG
MPRTRALVALAALLAVGLVGCKSAENPADLPAGPTLVSDAATAMKAVTSAHLKIDTDGQTASIPIKSAEGDLTRDGDAKGSIKLVVLTALLQLDFVVVGNDYYIKGVTGGWQKASAADVATYYDPSAVLDPDKGVANVLATATDAVTEGSETINSVDTYRVAVKLDSTAVTAIVPGVPAGVSGKIWLAKDTKQLVQAVLTLPGATAGTVTITLSDLDKPVTVSAPQ